jgi:hypothetical protein
MLRLDRRLVVCAVASAIVFALLLLPWPGLGVRFTRAYCAAANVFAHSFRLHEILQIDYRPAGAASSGLDERSDWLAALAIGNGEGRAVALRTVLHVRPLVYAPLCVFVALTACVPAPSVRLWVLSSLLALVLTLLFLALFTATATMWLLTQVTVAGGANRDPLAQLASGPVHLVELGRGGQWVLGMLQGFATSMGCEVILAVWAGSRWLTTFAHARWAARTQARKQAPPAARRGTALKQAPRGSSAARPRTRPPVGKSPRRA